MSAAELASIMARLDHKVERIEAKAVEGLVEFGHHVARLASAASPVETGDLRDSWLGGENGLNEAGIEVGQDKHGHFVKIGSALPYASKIEYEDVPMLRPALHQSEAELHTMVAAHVHTVTGVA